MTRMIVDDVTSQDTIITKYVKRFIKIKYSMRHMVYLILCDKFCLWLTDSQWFSPITLLFSVNKTYHHNLTEILLKAALKYP